MIKALYAASQAGVKIDLIVRGACALRPGVEGSPTTSACARSSAAFSSIIASGISRNGGKQDVYLASADWMGRNLFRRIEVAFPVLDPELKARVIDEGLESRISRTIATPGSWARTAAIGEVRPARRARRCATQELLLERLAERPIPMPETDRARMDLILWRHAEAEPGEPDLGRRLTAKGAQQAERMADWLDSHLPDTCRVLVSPADRAQQTAQRAQAKFRTVPELAPGATVDALLRAAGWPDAREPVLIVGHQPTLGEIGGVPAVGRRSAVERAQGRAVVAIRPARERGAEIVLKVVIGPDHV